MMTRYMDSPLPAAKGLPWDGDGGGGGGGGGACWTDTVDELCAVGLTKVDATIVVDKEVTDAGVEITDEFVFTDESSDGRIEVA